MPDLVTDGDNLGDHLATRSFKTIKGSDIASSTNITIGTSGNTFDVTGTTTIQHFDNANWAVGSVVSLHFDGALILTNNAGSLSGAKCNILLTGDTNYTTKAGDIITFLLHESTSWQEISRNSVASIPDNSISNAKLMAGIDAVKLADGSVTNSELKYINTLSDNAQNQLNLKSPIANPTFTGTVVLPNVPVIVTTQLNLKAGLVANTFTGDQNISGNKLIGGHTGTTTYIQETANNVLDIFVGGTARLNLTSDVAKLYNIKPYTTNTYDLGTTLAKYRNLNIKNIVYEPTVTATQLDFGGDQLQTISISVNTTFTTTGIAIGKSKTIKILNNATLHTLAFPAWKFVGAKPTDIAGSKTAILTLTCFGSADADIVAGYAVEE